MTAPTLYDPRDQSPYEGGAGYVLAVAGVATATLVAWVLARVLSGPNLVLYVFALYVFAVALVATRLTPLASILAAVLAALCFDLFFVPSVYALGTSETQYLVAFGVMIVLAILISDSAARIRAQTAALRTRQRELEIIIELDRALAEANRPGDVARIAAERSLPLLGVDAAAALLLDQQGKTLRSLHAAAVPPAVTAIFERGIPVGAGVAGQAVAERRPVIADVADYPDPSDVGLAAVVRDSGYAMLAATPIIAHGTVYGALVLIGRRPLHVTAALFSLLASIGTRLGLASSYTAEWQRSADQERMAALGRLAAGVAHELNNPLTAIANYVELSREEPSDTDPSVAARLSGPLAMVEEAVERMRRIVGGLSTYSKPPKPEPRTLNVGELMDATRELVGFSAKKSGVTVDVEAGPVLPPVVADRSAMMQVLLNLANNALEAMTARGGHLRLRAWSEPARRDPTSAVVKIAVSDTGPGIDRRDLHRIWDAFYTSKPEGTGLGLSIVRAIVAETPGATIDVESELGRGTTFTLTVPAASPGPA